MKILGIISAKEDPASRFRISQYEPYFTAAQEKLKIYCPIPLKEADPPKWAGHLSRASKINKWRIWNTAKLTARFPILLEQYKHDIIWQNRLLLNTYFYIEAYYKKPFIFDIDDAIWLLEGEKPIQKAFAKAAAVITGNSYLAEYAKKINPNTHIIPTSIDTAQLFSLPKKDNTFTIGWIGSYHNFKYLETIKTPLLNFIRKNKDTRFILVSSHPPSFLNFDNDRIIFKKWSLEKENELINEFSVGIMPLENNEWVKGKCSCKMLQYLACGIPAIVSPFGQNGIILSEKKVGLPAVTDEDWEQAMQHLKDDRSMYREMSINGINLVNEKYSCKINSSGIIEIFQKVK